MLSSCPCAVRSLRPGGGGLICHAFVDLGGGEYVYPEKVQSRGNGELN
jgi:hypothetical protein